MSLLLLKRDGNLRSFAATLAKEHLGTAVVELDAKDPNLDLNLERDRISTVVIENGTKLSESLMTMIRKNNVTLVFKDCQTDDLVGIAAVCPSGHYVIVKNACNSRRQQVIVLDKRPPFEMAVKEVVEKKPIDQQLLVIPPVSLSDAWAGIKAGGERASASQVTKRKNDGEIDLSVVVAWIKDRRFNEWIEASPNKDVHYWSYFTNLIVVSNYSASPRVQEGFPEWLTNGKIHAFCAINISMYATKEPYQKFVQFKLTDAVGMGSIMGNDRDVARGFFNNNAKIFIWPGTGNDPHASTLPAGWFRPYIEPHTPNSATTYTSTTGWSVSVQGGGDPDAPSADVTATYSQSEQVTRTINDFSVRNVSDGSMTGWDFYYTAMDGDGWKNHNHYVAFWGYAIDDIADLAKSTLTCNSECVYQAPADTSERIDWNIRFKPEYGCLWSDGDFLTKHIWYLRNHVEFQKSMKLDMAVVRNPQQ